MICLRLSSFDPLGRVNQRIFIQQCRIFTWFSKIGWIGHMETHVDKSMSPHFCSCLEISIFVMCLEICSFATDKEVFWKTCFCTCFRTLKLQKVFLVIEMVLIFSSQMASLNKTSSERKCPLWWGVSSSQLPQVACVSSEPGPWEQEPCPSCALMCPSAWVSSWHLVGTK